MDETKVGNGHGCFQRTVNTAGVARRSGTTTATSHPGWGSSLWQSYCEWARQRRAIVPLVDDMISQLLFWVPLGGKDETSRFRESIWGCLQLHRVIFYVATDHHYHSSLDRSYGTSIAARSSYPVHLLRIMITILQSILPVLQELVKHPSDPRRTSQRQARIRLFIEAARCALRITLLVDYWLQCGNIPKVVPGILLHGGSIFHPSTMVAPTFEQERRRIERQQYVGRRTGRRLRTNETITSSPQNEVLCPKARIIVSELLYILRPLVTATIEGRYAPGKASWQSLLLCLGMDIISLAGLGQATMNGNPLTNAEIYRRKLRLLLYLLRSPIWETGSRRFLQHVESTLLRVPIFGIPISNVVWEYILYWKIYRLEEG